MIMVKKTKKNDARIVKSYGRAERGEDRKKIVAPMREKKKTPPQNLSLKKYEKEKPFQKKQLQLKKRVFPLEIPRLYLSVMIDGPQEVNVSHGINFHAFLGAGFPASNYLANYASSNAGPDHQAFSILTIQIRHLWFHLPEKVDSLSRGKYLPWHGSWKAWGIVLCPKNCSYWVFFF